MFSAQLLFLQMCMAEFFGWLLPEYVQFAYLRRKESSRIKESAWHPLYRDKS